MKSIDAVLVLHDIRSAENVGSLLRTADAAGIKEVFLSSITPGVLDRFGRQHTKVLKASLGAERTVATKHYQDIHELITNLKGEGFTVVAIEQSPNSVDYKTVDINAKVAFILGPEVSGLASEIVKRADVVAEIPMRGSKESLNVAVAGGIAIFRMLGI
jgi:tRNA G18 (ribose-2'-O)-methylase SpoU